MDEWEKLQNAASDYPVSTYIKSIVFKSELSKVKSRGKRPVKDYQALAKILAQFGKSNIAGDMNQLAQAAACGSLPVNDEVISAITQACEDIDWIKHTLISSLGIKPANFKPRKLDS